MKILTALLALFVVGCSTLPRTVPGDSYSTAVASNGRATWARTVDSEKWCEWFYGDRIAGGPWLVVAFDLAEWEAWTSRRLVGVGKVVTVDRAARAVSVDGVVYGLPPEPRAKWARYCLSNGLQSPRD